MRPIRFSSARLEALFRDATVATLPQLKAALGTTVDLTVFRKLSALPYRTSYSHRGAYYTLDTLAQYDDLGLWFYRDIYFSRHGTLLDTAATLVTKATAGYLVDELEAVVHVATKDALRQLAQQGRLYRREWEGRYLYCDSVRRDAEPQPHKSGVGKRTPKTNLVKKCQQKCQQTSSVGSKMELKKVG